MFSAWYDRLALVLMNHYNATAEEKEEKLIEATQVCIDGLLDEDTHMSTCKRRLVHKADKQSTDRDYRNA
jgi:Fanconi-associated nuclease 1